MSDIFEEVEDSLRQDKATLLWQRFAPFVWGLLAIAVAGVAGREYLIAQDKEATEARAQVLEQGRDALQDGDYTLAAERFDEIVSEGGPSAPVAAHYLARIRVEGNGDLEAAQAVLNNAANPDGAPFEKLATLKVAYLTADTASMEELEATLGTMIDDESAFGALARELVAAKAFADGDVARARQMFGYLKFDANAPAGLGQRADIALAALPPAAAPPPAPVEEAPADTAPEEVSE